MCRPEFDNLLNPLVGFNGLENEANRPSRESKRACFAPGGPSRILECRHDFQTGQE